MNQPKGGIGTNWDIRAVGGGGLVAVKLAIVPNCGAWRAEKWVINWNIKEFERID